MQTLLWIDDVRNPKNHIDVQKYDVVWIKSYSEFVQYLESYDIPDIIWIDHDLGDDKSGFDCAKYLIKMCQFWDADLPEFYSQSLNPVGKANILGLLESYRRFRMHINKYDSRKI